MRRLKGMTELQCIIVLGNLKMGLQFGHADSTRKDSDRWRKAQERQ